MKLTEDEKEFLVGFIASDAYRVVLKVLGELTEEQVLGVTRLDLSSADDRALLISKARGEGAQRLLANFASFCQKKPKN